MRTSKLSLNLLVLYAELQPQPAPCSGPHLFPHATSDLSLAHDPNIDDDDRSRITKQKNKPYQKQDLGQSHKMSRSKSALDKVSND